MKKFEDFCMRTDLMEQFDLIITDYESINEAQIGDLDIANVIMTGLDGIKSQDVKALIGGLATIAKLMGRKVRDVIKLFSNEGFTKVRDFIDSDILGSEEIKYLIRMKDDPNRYKGFKGLEQYIRDLKEDDPHLLDSLKKAVNRILT